MFLNCGAREDSWDSLDSMEIKPVNPEGNQEQLLKPKLRYFDHLMRRSDSLEKTLMLEMTEGRKIRGRQRMRWLDGITDSMNMSLSKFQKLMTDWESWHAAVHRVTTGAWMSDSTTLNWTVPHLLLVVKLNLKFIKLPEIKSPVPNGFTGQLY